MPNLQGKPTARPVNNQTRRLGAVDITRSGAAIYVKAKAATERDPLRRWIWRRLAKGFH